MVGQVQLVAGSNGQQQMVIIPMTQQGAALQPAGVTMPAGELFIFNVQDKISSLIFYLYLDPPGQIFFLKLIFNLKEFTPLECIYITPIDI